MLQRGDLAPGGKEHVLNGRFSVELAIVNRYRWWTWPSRWVSLAVRCERVCVSGYCPRLFMKPAKKIQGRHCFWNVLTLGLGMLFIAGRCAPAEAAEERGISVEPLPMDHSKGHAAVFVGVNSFEDESIRPLKYAVNDAIAQAQYFILELKLVPATNAQLLLSGTPTPEFQLRLADLVKAGVVTNSANKSRILRAIFSARVKPKSSEDLLLVSFSSHGFEDPQTGVPYVLPQDGLLTSLSETAVSLIHIEAELDKSVAQKRLLLIDACRENTRTDGKNIGGAGQMTKRFVDALAAASGRLALASCDKGQLSYENDRLGHGVFTAKLLEALRGKAGESGQEFLTLGQVANYVSREVREWVRLNKPGVPEDQLQNPWFKGPESARAIPLGLSREYLAQQERIKAEALAKLREMDEQKKQLEDRRGRALLLLKSVRANSASRVLLSGKDEDEVEKAVKTLTGPNLLKLLEQVEGLENPSQVRVGNFKLWWSREGRAMAGLESDSRSPQIVTPPRAAVVRAESAVELKVDAEGQAPLFYQWRKNSESIPGATNNPYRIDRATAASVGRYEVEVSNGAGRVLSSAARVDVKYPPEILQPPGPLSLQENESLLLRVLAEGEEPLRYQWLKDGTVIGGAIQKSYAVSPVDLTLAGLYAVEVSDRWGTNRSPSVKVEIKVAPPRIARQPQAVSQTLGQPFQLDVDARGGGLLRYQWRRNGVPLAGATQAVYRVEQTLSESPGYYVVEVSNEGGTIPSTSVEVAVRRQMDPFTVTTIPNVVVNMQAGNRRTNSLGMVFAPLPGSSLYFSIWETRVGDYGAFARETGIKWPKPRFSQTDDHPAVNVTWEDARKFCDWLTKHEQQKSLLSASQKYRLPKDAEWSAAVGLPIEKEGHPEFREGRIKQFPWGEQWPPPANIANVGKVKIVVKRSTALGRLFGGDDAFEERSLDQFEFTAPVGSFSANSYGLFDMSGNVWEWCEDWYSSDNKDPVTRGGGFKTAVKDMLLASARSPMEKRQHEPDLGFRCVLDGPPGAPAPGAAATR